MTLQKYKEDSLVTIFKDNAKVVHVFHVDGPYTINCDGQIGETFVWSDCGLKLIFPQNCTQEMIQVTMSTFLPIRNKVHPEIHIVSAVYQFKCNIKHFDIPIILHLQHCVNLQSSEDCHKMWFASQHGDNIDIKHGNFDIGNSYGTLNLQTFCYIYAFSSKKKKCDIEPIHVVALPNQNDQSEYPININSYPTSASSKVVSDASHDDYESSGGQHHSSLSVDISSCINRTKQEEIEKKWGYEWMLALPKDHTKLPKWNGIYSVYIKLAAWRKVCTCTQLYVCSNLYR